MTDALTLLALGLSVITLAVVLFVAVTLRRKQNSNPDQASLESTVNEVKGLVTTLHGPVSQMLTEVGEIKQATTQTSSGMVEIKKFTDLLSGSSQKRGKAGEIIVRQYLERLPRQMWDEQYAIAGAEGRVDYVLRIYSGGSPLLLPIDSKFSLPESDEDFDDVANGLARERAIEIVKYIVPGVTTDFAVMVLPNPVFYALTSETVSMMEQAKVVPCPPEGVIILSSFAMRAHQAVILARGAERLRASVVEIDSKLERISEDLGKWAKNLRGASKYAKQTLDDLADTRSALGDITSRLETTGDAKGQIPSVEQPLSLISEKAPEEPSEHET